MKFLNILVCLCILLEKLNAEICPNASMTMSQVVSPSSPSSLTCPVTDQCGTFHTMVSFEVGNTDSVHFMCELDGDVTETVVVPDNNPQTVEDLIGPCDKFSIALVGEFSYYRNPTVVTCSDDEDCLHNACITFGDQCDTCPNEPERLTYNDRSAWNLMGSSADGLLGSGTFFQTLDPFFALVAGGGSFDIVSGSFIARCDEPDTFITVNDQMLSKPTAGKDIKTQFTMPCLKNISGLKIECVQDPPSPGGLIIVIGVWDLQLILCPV